MNILISSHRFWPDLGGIETASALLAQEFASRHHEVRIITETAESDDRSWPFPIVRRPSPREILSLAGWCDVFFQNNISLKSLWAGLLLRKPCVVTHQTWIRQPNGASNWTSRLKRALLRFTTNVSISEPIAEHIGVPSVRIDNPYDEQIFRAYPGIERSLELAYLGRLVSDKGVDILLDAMGKLHGKGLRPQLTIIGQGPEEAAMRQLVKDLYLGKQVSFAGSLSGDSLSRMLNRHKILVIPSRWAEPFGIVALEAIACGCVVVGSEKGGLPQAIGPCGLTVPNENAGALADALARLLSDPELLARYRGEAARHLKTHTAQAVADAYLKVFAAASQ